MSKKTKEKLCVECKKKPAKPHWDNGLFCGDNMCDECFEKMRRECRRRSW